MSFTSTIFILFIAAFVLLYYIFPQKKRWWVLLGASYVFYISFSVKALAYLIPTTVAVFLFAKWMSSIQQKFDLKLAGITDKAQKKEIKAQCKSQKKKVLTLSLIFTIGILCVLKYTNFICINAASLASVFKPGTHFDAINFFVPLGLSFYTFSAASYLFDVYNNKYKAETNFGKMALFMSYFPSIIQGPINRYNQLNHEFFEKDHNFDLTQIQFGIQRVLWGFLKKLVIADRADQVVTYIFGSYESLPSFIILFGLFFYAIELYADFAGGMDIALGVSELFGVKLPENFRQPYFATSVGDFWRRWHITLGAWMKDYIFYPFSLSPSMTNLSKKLMAKSKQLSRVLPACLGNLLIFLIVGFWHGAEWHFIFWGLYQGIIIAVSTLLEPLYPKWKSFLHINDKSFGWKVFMILRTFFIILVGYIVDEIADMHAVVGMTKQLFDFTNFNLISNFSCQGFGVLTIIVVLVFSAIWFFVSVLKEKGIDVRVKIASLNLPVRWMIYLALILSTPFFQASDSIGFMYANF